jgi:putative nucleotidyltransferase-like protein
MAIDAATAELFSSLAQVGARARLLKGPSIAGWLYDDPDEREYGDCDVLIAPESVADAERALEALGYEREYDDRALPDWWREHASAWLRHRDGVSVDLHRTLAGIGVPDAECWRLLSADPGTSIVGNRQLPALALPARALHVTLHAAQHGAGWGTTIRDLDRAIERGDDKLWRETVALARRLGAEDALAAGLGLSLAGRTLAERHGVPATASVGARLRAAGAPSPALGFEALALADGLRQQAGMVWRKLAPPVAYMRRLDPRARRGAAGLALAYAHRSVWLLRSAPSGLRAWLAMKGH